jgi:hypothetical protein
MLWFFERSDEQIEVETRFDNTTREYVVIIRRPDQKVESSRYRDPESLRIRLAELTEELESDDWLTSGPPVILPDGWPNKPPQ